MIFTKNIEECNPNKKHKIFILIACMLTNKKLNPIVIELFVFCFYHAILFC